ncbi:MAG: hypothetical protein AAGN82_01320, partial [Myxococcota bacterium]
VAFLLAPRAARATSEPASAPGGRPVAAAAGATGFAPGPDDADGYAYFYDDDEILSTDLAVGAARLVVRPGPIRRTLIRPRLHFVPEFVLSADVF